MGRRWTKSIMHLRLCVAIAVNGCGNIIVIVCTFANATEKYSYVYDEANQLVSESHYYGSGNTNNATYTYTYDDWGNILSKTRYAYSTTSLKPGEALDTVIYGYSDSDWGDILSYMTIGNRSYQHFYDDMGNPTSYLDATLSWEGKQLVAHVTSSSSSGSNRQVTTTFLLNPKEMNQGYKIVATIHSHSYSAVGDYHILSEDRGNIGDAYVAKTYGYCYMVSPDMKLYRMNRGVAGRYKEYDPRFPMNMFFVILTYI